MTRLQKSAAAIVAAGLSLSLTSTAPAAEREWIGELPGLETVGDGFFQDASNWSPAAVPGVGDIAVFDHLHPVQSIEVHFDADALELLGIGVFAPATITFNLRGHDVSLTGGLSLLDSEFSQGQLSVTNAHPSQRNNAFDVGGDVFWWRGNLTVGPGVDMNIAGSLDGPDDFLVRGGATVTIQGPIDYFVDGFQGISVDGIGSQLHVGQSILGEGSNTLSVTDNGSAHVAGNSASTPRLENGVLDLGGQFALGFQEDVTGTSGVFIYNPANLTPNSDWTIHRPLGTVALEIDLNIAAGRTARVYSLGQADFGPTTTLGVDAVLDAPDGVRLGDNRRIIAAGSSTIDAELTLAGGVLDAQVATTLAREIHGFGVVIGAAVPTASRFSINRPNGTVVLDQTLDVGNRTAVIYSSRPARLGRFTTLSGGTLRIQSGISGSQPVIGSLLLGADATLGGSGDVIGDFYGSEFSRINATTLRFGGSNPANSRSFVTDGDIVVLGQLELNTTAPAALGRLTQLNGGTLLAPNGIVLRDASTLAGSGSVNSVVIGARGSSIHAEDGNLALGDAGAPHGFATDGQLHTGLHQVTLNDSNQAVLGSLTTLGDGAGNPGRLAAENGVLVEFGRNIVGHGTIDTPNDPLRPTIINGHAAGNSAAEPLTFDGYVKGVGTFADIVFNGTFAPGLSPAAVETGSLAFGSQSVLQIELGGFAPGREHDQLVVGGSLQLDGTLLVELINGFQPGVGDQFEILNYESLSGAFDHVEFGGALRGVIEYGASSLMLTVTQSVPEPSTAILAAVALLAGFRRIGGARNMPSDRRGRLDCATAADAA